MLQVHMRHINYAKTLEDERLIESIARMRSYNGWLNGMEIRDEKGHTWKLKIYIEEAEKRGLLNV